MMDIPATHYAKSGDVRAVLLGERSYGKGSVQNVWQLPGGADAAVKITTQYYHLPGGRMIHRLPGAATWGVEPNLMVDMLPGQMADALILRQNADVLKLDENGNVLQTVTVGAGPMHPVFDGTNIWVPNSISQSESTRTLRSSPGSLPR